MNRSVLFTFGGVEAAKGSAIVRLREVKLADKISDMTVHHPISFYTTKSSHRGYLLHKLIQINDNRSTRDLQYRKR
jgi:hypothetical protein